MSSKLTITNCNVELHNPLLPTQWSVESHEDGRWFVCIYLECAYIEFEVEPGTTRESIAAEVGLPLQQNNGDQK